MNPVFWLLVILIIVVLWFVLIPIFRKVGRISVNLFSRAKNEMKIKERESEGN